MGLGLERRPGDLGEERRKPFGDPAGFAKERDLAGTLGKEEACPGQLLPDGRPMWRGRSVPEDRFCRYRTVSTEVLRDECFRDGTNRVAIASENTQGAQSLGTAS